MKPSVIFTKLNAELFQFLAKSLPNRTSRFNAFLYLYERQEGHFDALLKYGVNIPFGTTYNQLAKRWGWDRKTVMSFLKSLHKMGVLEVKRASRNIEIRILNLACVPQETSLEIMDDPP
jgi:DNA-binding MarR family transcriptional regulator